MEPSTADSHLLIASSLSVLCLCLISTVCVSVCVLLRGNVYRSYTHAFRERRHQNTHTHVHERPSAKDDFFHPCPSLPAPPPRGANSRGAALGTAPRDQGSHHVHVSVMDRRARSSLQLVSMLGCFVENMHTPHSPREMGHLGADRPGENMPTVSPVSPGPHAGIQPRTFLL